MIIDKDGIKSKHLSIKDNIDFCKSFKNKGLAHKYIFGRNIYAKSILDHIDVDGIVDDFTEDTTYLGKPIIKMNELPEDALVLNVAGGRPLSARHRLNEAKLKNLHYFTFFKLSELPLVPIRFNEGFEEEFIANEGQYNWAYSILADDISKSIFEKLVNFRLSYDLAYLEGFKHREKFQYFEDFLGLQKTGETFLDVGSFDGFTSLEFIKHCPGYKSIHVFEPDPDNYPSCVNALKGKDNIYFHAHGLSDEKTVLKFDMQGSSSTVSESGEISILVEKLDDLECNAPSFIKIDIEGGELAAIAGAKGTILAHHPKLAIAAYHAAGDFWRIPQQILAIRDDYDVYMRHYTESIYETVLFFIPRVS